MGEWAPAAAGVSQPGSRQRYFAFFLKNGVSYVATQVLLCTPKSVVWLGIGTSKIAEAPELLVQY